MAAPSSLLVAVLGTLVLASLPPTAAAASSCAAAGGSRRRLSAAAPSSSPKHGAGHHHQHHHQQQHHQHDQNHPKHPHHRHQRSLLQDKTASANGAGYSALGDAPIAAAHAHLLPGTRDQMLLMNYFDASGSFPPVEGADVDGRTIARVFDRSDFSFGVVPVTTNAVCGAWAALPDGRIGMYAGHTPMGVQPAGFDNLLVYSPQDGRYGGIEDRGGLSRGRWYPGTCALASGRALIYGGSADVDFNDPAMDGDVFSYGSNDLERTAPMPAFFSDVAYGPYYPLLVALPSPSADTVLMALNSRAAVVVPQTGEVLARAPPFPEPFADLSFEYPMSGSLAMLPADERLATFGAPGGAEEARVTIAVTGGVVGAQWYRDYKICQEDNRQLRPCSDGVLTIGLDMRVAADGGVEYAFDEEWRVARMAPRCVHDAVVLPHGKILIINGVGKGYAGLGDCQLAHDPHNEPWVYDPVANEAAPTGLTTRVPRLYHGMAALTTRGDVLVTGTTNTKGWENSQGLPLDESPFGSEYRAEIFTPREIAAGVKRPEIVRSPTMAYYGGGGGEFEIVSDEALSAVVLMQPGGSTHGMALNQRAQRLPFVRAAGGGGGGGFRYRVTPPAAPRNAPEGHYLLFGVAADGDGYSEGAWLLLREAADAPLQTLPVGAVRVAQASTGFEAEDADGFQCGAPCELRNGAASAGTGEQGARLVRGEGGDAPWSAVLLASGDVDAGDLTDKAAGGDSDGCYVYASLWARGGVELTVAWADVAAVAAGARETDRAAVPGTRATVHLTGDGGWRHYVLQPVQLPRGAGRVRLVVGGADADIDDVEVWASGTSTVVNAAFRSAVRSVQRQQQMRAATMSGGGGKEGAAAAGAAHHGGGVRRNERFLSPKARAFGVFA